MGACPRPSSARRARDSLFERAARRRTCCTCPRACLPARRPHPSTTSEDMLWDMYSKFVVGRLVRKGYPALDAQKMVEDKHPSARQELLNESKERPVLLNRAPSLHRFSVLAAYPKITSGRTILLNPFAEKGTNSDYDGDTMQVHVPITP